METKINQEQEKSEKLILNLDETRQSQFANLKTENKQYLEQIGQLKSTLEGLTAQYKQLEEQVGHNPLKQKAMSLYQRLTQVKEKRAELELSLQKSQLESGPQERNRLLEQVKTDNLETSGMERKIAETQDQIKKIKEQLSAIGGELDAAEADKQAKFEELIKKDAEMQEFLDSFDLKKDEIVSSSVVAQQDITGKLMKIHGLSVKTTQNLPTKKDFSDLNMDLSVKQTDLKNADSTTDALTREREQRLEDLEKVAQLEKKLANEVTVLNQKIDALKKSMRSVDNLDESKANAEAEIKVLYYFNSLI